MGPLRARLAHIRFVKPRSEIRSCAVLAVANQLREGIEAYLFLVGKGIVDLVFGHNKSPGVGHLAFSEWKHFGEIVLWIHDVLLYLSKHVRIHTRSSTLIIHQVRRHAVFFVMSFSDAQRPLASDAVCLHLLPRHHPTEYQGDVGPHSEGKVGTVSLLRAAPVQRVPEKK